MCIIYVMLFFNSLIIQFYLNAIILSLFSKRSEGLIVLKVIPHPNSYLCEQSQYLYPPSKVSASHNQ